MDNEALEQQSFEQPQHNQFQSNDIPEVIVEQVEEELEEVNEDVSQEMPPNINAVNNDIRDKQNELLKQLESLKMQFQNVVQERNQEVSKMLNWIYFILSVCFICKIERLSIEINRVENELNELYKMQ